MDNTILQMILLSQTDNNTGAHLQQPNSEAHEAHEAEDRCFQMSLARLMLAHPVANNPGQHLAHVPKRQRRQASMRPPHRRPPTTLHCLQKRWWGNQRHSTLARCLADLITTQTGTKVYSEQTIPGFPPSLVPVWSTWTLRPTCAPTRIT